MSGRKLGLHITHTDADGVGCAIVGLLDKEYCYDTYCCNTGNSENNASDKLMELIGKEKWESVLISDVSITDEVAAYINEYCKKNNIELLMVDHHPTNKLGEKYEWVKMAQPIDGRPISATEQLALIRNNRTLLEYDTGMINNPDTTHDDILSIQNIVYSVLILSISRYDTWEWKKHPDPYGQEDFTSILMTRDKDPLITAKTIVANILTKGFAFSKEDMDYVNSRRKENKKIIEENAKRARLIKFNNFDTIAYISEDMHISEFAEYVKIRSVTEYDIVLGLDINKRLLSFRTSKEDIDLGQIAALYGGGGHKQAAGASNVEPMSILNILNKYYKGEPIEWKEFSV